MAAPFVGRDGELSAIANVAGSILHDREPAAILVLAEPGHGKTRLLAEVGQPAGFAHHLPVHGYEPERNVPLAAAREMLRRLGDGDGLKGDPIAVIADDQPATLEPVRLFEAIHRAVRKLGPDGPVDRRSSVGRRALARVVPLPRPRGDWRAATPIDGGGGPAVADCRNVWRGPATIARHGSVSDPRTRADPSRRWREACSRARSFTRLEAGRGGLGPGVGLAVLDAGRRGRPGPDGAGYCCRSTAAARDGYRRRLPARRPRDHRSTHERR